jgi:hypothetical protein
LSVRAAPLDIDRDSYVVGTREVRESRDEHLIADLGLAMDVEENDGPYREPWKELP